jgi:hypothetical protein
LTRWVGSCIIGVSEMKGARNPAGARGADA